MLLTLLMTYNTRPIQSLWTILWQGSPHTKQTKLHLTLQTRHGMNPTSPDLTYNINNIKQCHQGQANMNTTNLQHSSPFQSAFSRQCYIKTSSFAVKLVTSQTHHQLAGTLALQDSSATNIILQQS